MSGQSFFKSSSSSINLNVQTLTPLKLSKVFKIPVSDLLLQDEDKNAIMADNDTTFDSTLLPNNVYDVIDNSKNSNQVSVKTFSSLIPSEEEKMGVIQQVTEHPVIQSLEGPAKGLAELIPASASIEKLLVAVATAPDCSLISSSIQAFTYLKHPKSMKVSVTQAAQEMTNVIQKNKSDLDAINLKMSFVSEQFKYILPAIWTKNVNLVISTADKMGDATDACVQKTDECAKRCEDLLLLIQELFDALLASQEDAKSKDTELCQNLKKIEEHITIVKQKHDRRKRELDEQQSKFESAWQEHREQQKRSGSMVKNFAAGWCNILSFGTANARKGMDNAYTNATDNKKEERDMLMQFKEKFNDVENEMMNLKISFSKDKMEKEGLHGLIAAIGEAVQRIGELSVTVQNMQEYFRTIKNLVTETFQGNAKLFIEHAKNDNTTSLENKLMMEAVMKVYAIFFVVQSFATIYSIAASSEKVSLRLSRATKYLGLTPAEAKAKQLELALEDTKEDTEVLKKAIEAEMQKRIEQSTPNIVLFITNCVQLAQRSIQN